MRTLSLVLLVAFVAACSYSDSPEFGAAGSSGSAGVPGLPGVPGVPGSSSGASGGSSGRQPGDPPPATCGDGAKNGDESDVDCGGSCDAKCGVGAACAVVGDCGGGACTGGTCQPETGSDGLKNGDESGLDCGGSTTGAPRCATGSTCNVHADCASNGCKAGGTCADAPSCVGHMGGDTCGAGDVGSGQEQHESCCTSVPFPGYSDGEHPNQAVSIDRYEITAGRMRAFITRMAEEHGGQPNVRAWIQAHRPVHWDDAWTALLPSDYESANYGVYTAFTAYGDDDQGFHIHGTNCNQGPGSYGHSTYWLPPDVLQSYAGGAPRAFTQDELDTKAMSCMTHVVASAFCAWDGGQLVTFDALNQLTGSGQSLANLGAGTIQIFSDAGNAFNEPYAYYGPHAGTDSDEAARVVPPGRIAADVFTGPGGGVWYDLGGNLNEMASDGMGFRLMNDGADGQSGNRFLGIGYHSATVSIGGGIDNLSAMRQPQYKAGVSGARCMRFQ